MAAKDPYKVLGVSPSASEKEVRASYRRLAKQFHPDRNPGDSKAEERFKEINNAFAIIGDKDKRRAFDRGEIDAQGHETHPFARAHQQGAGPHGGEAGGAEDIFAHIFGGGRQAGFGAGFGGGFRQPRQAPQRGQDLRYRISVPFLEAARGGKRRITMPDGRSLDVTIPEGLHDGQSLRLKGKGGPGFAGGPAGDLYVDVAVTPHPYFRLEKGVVWVDVPVSLREAVLGETIRVPTVHGPVSLKIPKGASSGAKLRVKGKGIKDPKTGKMGDQLIKLQILLPPNPDPALEQFIKGWHPDGFENMRKKFGV